MVLYKRDFLSKNILILGASGLLGQALSTLFLSRGYYVGVASRNPNNLFNINTVHHSVNVLDRNLIDNLIKSYDIIINCTGQITNPINNCLLVNTDGIRNIVSSIKKHNKKLIHISSTSVYGSGNYVNENSEVNPVTVYGSLKYFAEFLIKSSLSDYLILRVSNLYGKEQKKGIINYLTQSYLNKNKNIYFNNDGTMKRYFLHNKDLAEIIFLLFQEEVKGLYNIVGNEQVSIRELILKFESLLNYKFNVQYESSLPLENIDKIDDKKINDKIKFTYNHTLDNYIEELAYEIN